MFSRARVLALMIAGVAGAIMPVAAKAQDGYYYGGNRSYYYSGDQYYNRGDRCDDRDRWRDHEWRERERREHEYREQARRRWMEHERWEHRFGNRDYAPQAYFYYGR